MNNLKKPLKFLPATVLFLLCAVFVSCQKGDDNLPDEAALSIMQASPDAPSLNFFLDNKKVNTNGLSFSDYVDYFRVYAGTRVASVFEGSESDATLSDELDLKPNGIYSLYIAGKWDDGEYVLLNDTLTAPASGKARVRFVNLSPGAPSLDLGLADGSTLAGDRTFKSTSKYLSVDGDKTYSFQLREKGSTTVKASLSKELKAGKIYTIVSKGLYTGSGTTGLAIQAILNY